MTLSTDTVDFLCLGAQKCGTSALTVVLGEHPQLSVPRHPAPFGMHAEGDTPVRLAELFAGRLPTPGSGSSTPVS